jgi:NAD(P)-dependent dehydrogenase (short-subunit alcohol dehydrogenase family)
MAQPQTVIVTGATSGIGRAAADLLTREGYVVFGTSRTPSRESGVGFEMLPLDVRSDSSVDACVATVLERTGRLDVLVNNAGYMLVGPAEETTVEEAKEQFETNFFGVVRMTRAALRVMRRQGEGSIVQVGSLAGSLAIPFGGFYSATKFALEGLSEALWHELASSGIRIALVQPSFARTQLGSRSRLVGNEAGAYATARDRVVAAIRRSVESGTSPERIAQVIARTIRSRSPRLRNRVGTQANLLPVLKALLPWSIFAGGVRKSFDLDSAPARKQRPVAAS